MTTPRVRPVAVEVLEVDGLRLVEDVAPALSVDLRRARDAAWDEAVRSNPWLFDGPTVLCVGVRWEGSTCLVVSWARGLYRDFALRRVPGAAGVSSLFVAVVQPTDEGRVLVGRMALSTAAPGRVQLPGGSVEPPAVPGSLDVAALGEQAARELAEETGIETAAEDLSLLAVTRGEHDNLGVFFGSPSRPESVVRDRFAALVAAQAALGQEPELAEIGFVRAAAGLDGVIGPSVDYLAPLLKRVAVSRRG